MPTKPARKTPKKPEKKWVLVRFTDNWADEFDVDAMYVLPADEWEKKKQGLRDEWPANSTTLTYGEFRGKPCFRAGFGTNQWIEYENIDAYLARFVVKEVSAEWAETFRKLCGDRVVGVLPYRWIF